jgi:hypothetical protein
MILIAFSAQAGATGIDKKEANEQYLTVNPKRCVALRQGQVCYQEIRFTWQALTEANFCLYDEQSNNPLKCWTGKSKGSFAMDFQSPTSRNYILKNEDKNEMIASAKFIVAWVYGNKKRRRTSWRLF